MGKGFISRRGLDTSDATAITSDIRSGKTAYVKGAKLMGTATVTDTATITLQNSGTSAKITLYVDGTSIDVAPSTSASISAKVPCNAGVAAVNNYNPSGAATLLNASASYGGYLKDFAFYRVTGSATLYGAGNNNI